VSLEAKIEALTSAINELNHNLTSGQFTAPAANDAPAAETTKAAQTTQTSEPEQVWYHKPETREVWQEPEQGRRKGITKVDEGTAQRLIAQYAEEAAQQAAAAGQPDDDLDMDFGGDDNPLVEDAAPMDDTEFAQAWKDWTQRAVKAAMADGAEKDAAQMEVKKFIVPKVREHVGEGEAKVGNVPADRRRAFLAEAEQFFA